MQVLAFRLLSKTEAIAVYEYFSSPMQQQLIGDFRQPEVLGVIDGMSPDDRARLFDELPAKVVKQVLQELTPAKHEATSRSRSAFVPSVDVSPVHHHYGRCAGSVDLPECRLHRVGDRWLRFPLHDPIYRWV